MFAPPGAMLSSRAANRVEGLIEDMIVRLVALAALTIANPRQPEADDQDKSHDLHAFRSCPYAGNDLLPEVCTGPDRPRDFRFGQSTPGISGDRNQSGQLYLFQISPGVTRAQLSQRSIRRSNLVQPTGWMSRSSSTDCNIRKCSTAARCRNFQNSTGFGDVFLRTKVNLFGNDSGPIGFALNPLRQVAVVDAAHQQRRG